MIVFVKSYEDNTYIGRRIDIYRAPWYLRKFDDIIEALKLHGSGKFIFTDSPININETVLVVKSEI